MLDTVLVLTGPSGVGKDSLVQILNKEKDLALKFQATKYNTTRTPRKFTSYSKLNKLFLQYLKKDNLDWKKLQAEKPALYFSYIDENVLEDFFNEIKAENYTSLQDYLDRNYGKLSYEAQLENLHDEILWNALLPINGENNYSQWLNAFDADFIKQHNLALCDTELHGNYYAQTWVDVVNVAKNKVCLVNATPDTWKDLDKKLKELNLNVVYLWITGEKEELRARMLKRGDSIEKINERLKNDDKIWNEKQMRKLKKLNVIYLDGAGSLDDLYTKFKAQVYPALLKSVKNDEKLSKTRKNVL